MASKNADPNGTDLQDYEEHIRFWARLDLAVKQYDSLPDWAKDKNAFNPSAPKPERKEG